MTIHKLGRLSVWFIFIPWFALGASSPNLKKDKKGVTMKTDSVYSMAFAGPARDSYINTTTKAKGKITWSSATDATATSYWRPNILLWGQNIVVSTYGDIFLFDQAGKKLWTKPYQPATPIVVRQDYLYYKNRSLFLTALDSNDKKIIDDGAFPGAMSSEVKVEFFYPRKTDFVTAVFDKDQHDHQEGEDAKSPQPSLTIVRNRYEISYGDWHHKLDAENHLPPVFFPETDMLVLWTPHFIKIDTKNEKQISKIDVPIENAIEWSVGPDENYFLLAKDKTKSVLVSLNSLGKEQWRWTLDVNTAPDKKIDETWLPHPPILNHKGTVYAFTNQRIIAIENGKQMWHFLLPAPKDSSSWSRHYASALADNTILVTSGKTLFYIDSKGTKIWSLDLSSEILTSPVVDIEGNIFVATATEVVRIN